MGKTGKIRMCCETRGMNPKAGADCKREKERRGHTTGADVEFPSVVPTGRPHDGTPVSVVLNQNVRLGRRRGDG
jgi:hypothetical protein